MKNQIILGMALALTANFAFAAGPVRSAVEVKNQMTEESKRSKDRNSIDVLRGTVDSQIVFKAANEVSKIGGADQTELKIALAKSVKVQSVEGEKTLSLMDVGQKLLMAEQTMKKLNRNDLTADGKLHLEAMENMVKASSEFLSLANKMSDGATEQSKLEIAAFNKQLLIIAEQLTTMDTGDLKAHTAKMKAAVAARTSPGITGDQAFAASLKQGKTATEYAQLLKDILGCI
jgi:hypothetical protein